jgi:hypothetical protein
MSADSARVCLLVSLELEKHTILPLRCATPGDLTPGIPHYPCVHGLYFPHSFIDWPTCALCLRMTAPGCTVGIQNSSNRSSHGRIAAWHGQPRPEGFRTIRLESHYPTATLIRRLDRLGFPRNAMHGFSPLTNRYESSSAEHSKWLRYRERLARGETVNPEQFEIVMALRYYPPKIKEGLRQILVTGEKVAKIAATIGQGTETLMKRAQRLRKEIGNRFPKSYLHAAVEEMDDYCRDSRFQPYQFEKGLLSHRNDGDYDDDDKEYEKRVARVWTCQKSLSKFLAEFLSIQRGLGRSQNRFVHLQHFK